MQKALKWVSHQKEADDNQFLSNMDWEKVWFYYSLLVAVAVRSDVTVWDLSKMSPVSKTFMRQVTIADTIEVMILFHVSCLGPIPKV